MATIVFFHAHPDDESIATGGTMAQAADAGHRVVLVVATRGERGEPVPGVLEPGEALWQRRVVETRRSAEILGVAAVHFLGYVDSGMMGEETNNDPASFWQAEVEEAAERLAALLRSEATDLLSIYDEWGTYGHPDHIQVNRVGRRAAELAGLAPERVFEATMNRDRLPLPEGVDEATVAARTDGELPEPATLGVPEAMITHAIDVTGSIDRKAASMRAHASQISEDAFFLTMPPDVFRQAFGTEWYVCLGGSRPAGEPFVDDLFAGIGQR
jgi:LmbE family N-acetylglucosaminyl deacetylase